MNNVQATEVDASPSISLPVAYQGSTNTARPPIPVSTFDRPEEMSSNEYVKLLQAKIAAEFEASVRD